MSNKDMVVYRVDGVEKSGIVMRAVSDENNTPCFVILDESGDYVYIPIKDCKNKSKKNEERELLQ